MLTNNKIKVNWSVTHRASRDAGAGFRDLTTWVESQGRLLCARVRAFVSMSSSAFVYIYKFQYKTLYIPARRSCLPLRAYRAAVIPGR